MALVTGDRRVLEFLEFLEILDENCPFGME
jgi:hypothetical protein